MNERATAARLAAREQVLRLLALAASDPASKRFARVADADFLELARAAGDYLAAEHEGRDVELAPGEAPPRDLDLSSLVDALRARREQLEEDHVRVFGLVVSKECPPYEVQYCPQTFSVYRSQQLADIAGFYRAFGVEPGRDAPERADHIACEIEFQAWLVAKERHARSRSGDDWIERAELCLDAQARFAEEHFAWWVPAFASALRRRCTALDPVPRMHLELARALASYVALEREVLGVPPPVTLARPRLEHAEAADSCSGCSGAPA